MDNSLNQQSPVTRKPGGLWAGLQLVDRFLNWVASFIELTEEEQRDAGIYLGK